MRSHPTLEEREEYELPVHAGMVVYAGVDYEAIIAQAQAEADVLLWDGGNNDFPFITPDLLIVVVDPMRPGHELEYHPGEATLRMADVVLVNKIDSASADHLRRVLADVQRGQPGGDRAPRRLAGLAPGWAGACGPGGARGRGWPDGHARRDAVRGRHRGGATAWRLSSRSIRVRSRSARSPRRSRAIRTSAPVLPAMGYSEQQLRELEATINAIECDVVVAGTPIDLARLIDSRHPIRRATYELQPLDPAALEALLAPFICAASR